MHSDTATGESQRISEPPARKARRWLFAAVGLTAVAALLGGLVSRTDRDGRGSVTDDPGVVHVHGLGVNPGNGALYAATHTGLFRVDGGGSVARIADRYQDTMGFTVVGPDRFLASGHPDLREMKLRVVGKPPLLGLIESLDAGRTWRSRSLLGDADLHTIVATSGLLVAYDSTGGRVLSSSDGGTSWETRSQVPLVDLAVDPGEPSRMAAIDRGGSLQTSSDGGRSWTSSRGAPSGVVVLRWDRAGLWAGGRDGALHRGDPVAGTWDLVRRFDGAVEALAVDDADVYAAVDGSGIYRSGDGGQRWMSLYRPTG